MTLNVNPISGTGRGFAVLPDLTVARQREVQGALDSLGQLLASAQFRATLQLRLVDRAAAQQESYFTLMLDGGKVATGTEPSDKPDLELIMAPETWWEIASGRVAPHEAFLGGRMRVRGDFDLAQRILKHVAASPGRTQLCAGGE